MPEVRIYIASKANHGPRWRHLRDEHGAPFMVCDNCDGPDVLERWVQRNAEFRSDRFWALREDF